MNTEQLMKVLVAPRISEKSSRVADSNNQFVFEVARAASKPDIKKAVELMFEVEVKSVQVSNIKGKQKMFRRSAGRRPGIKKAYVTLKEGFDIEFLGGE